jgi:hypothetical protein
MEVKLSQKLCNHIINAYPINIGTMNKPLRRIRNRMPWMCLCQSVHG